MGFFRWLADTARDSNDRAHDRNRTYQENKWRQQEAESNRKKSLQCCANCMYFNRYDGQLNHCTKHDFCFNLDDVKYNEVEYNKVCGDFIRR